MRRLTLACILLQHLAAMAQPTIEWGPVFGNKDQKTRRLWVTAEDSLNLYIVKHRYFMRTHHWFIEGISKKEKNLVFSIEVPQPLDENKKPTGFYSVVRLGNKAYLLSVGEDKKHQVSTLYASILNQQNGRVTDTRAVYSTSVAGREKSIQFCSSPSGSNILLYPAPYDAEADEMKLCDENFNVLWSGPLKFSNKIKTNKNFSVCIDDKQNIALYSADLRAISVFSTGKKQGKNISILVPEGASIYNSLLKVTPRGDFYYLSMLKPERYDITSGFIQAFIDPEAQDVGVTNTITLYTSQLKEILGKNVGKKWAEMGLYYIRDVFFRNTDYVLIGEQEYDKRTFQPVYYSSLNPSWYGNSYLGYYYYPNFKPFVIEKQVNLISLFDLSYNGEVNWIKIIPKNQAYAVNTYLSFVAAYDDNNIYFVYNDAVGNINAKPPFGPRAMRNPKKAMGVFAEVDKSGKLTLGSFYRRKGNKRRVIKPAFCYTGNNSIFLFTESKRKARIGEFFLK